MCALECGSLPPQAPPPHQRVAGSAAGMSDDSGLVLKWAWPTTGRNNPLVGIASEENYKESTLAYKINEVYCSLAP